MNKKVRIISSSPRRGGNSETLAGTVFAGGVNGVGEIAGHPALEQAYQMGKEVYQTTSDALPSTAQI